MAVVVNRLFDRYPIWHALADGRRELAYTFVRFQECYECASPKFRGRVFTFKEFREWYAKTCGKGRFTYATDWCGFNVPSHIVRTVRDEFPRKSKLEKALLLELDSAGAFMERRFYLIGTLRDARQGLDATQHEIRHGLYYCNSSYRRAVQKALAGSGNRRLRRALRSAGYCKSVLDDEVQAYALTGWPDRYEPGPEDVRLAAALRRIEKRYL